MVESIDKPIECHYHDGGPDHNVQHIRNMLSNVAYFLQRNLDLPISVQTPPTCHVFLEYTKHWYDETRD